MAPVKKVPHQRKRHFLKVWRKHRNMTQQYVGERVHMSRESLSKIENGEVPYNQDLLERLAVLYGCEVDDLVAVHPERLDIAKAAYNEVKRASAGMQEKALGVLKVMLKVEGDGVP